MTIEGTSTVGDRARTVRHAAIVEVGRRILPEIDRLLADDQRTELLVDAGVDDLA